MLLAKSNIFSFAATTGTALKKIAQEPKPKKSKTSVIPEVIEINSSPEPLPKEANKPSKLSLGKEGKPDVPKDTGTKSENCSRPVIEASCDSASADAREDAAFAKLATPPKVEFKIETPQKRDRVVQSCAITPHRALDLSADQDLCSQSVEASCDVIWQSSSPITFSKSMVNRKIVTEKLVSLHSYCVAVGPT